MRKCKECSYCEKRGTLFGVRRLFYCVHPDQKSIANYFRDHRMTKAIGFLCYGEKDDRDLPAIKTSPRWCPLRKEQGNE